MSDTSNRIIDLRSDTVTRPSPGMLKAMMEADVGDDVYGEDPTANALEEYAADLLGKEAALFVCSGTQGNLLSLLSHCRAGEEILTGADYHVCNAEAGGAAALGGITICPLPMNERGGLVVDSVEAAIKPDDPHYPITRLLSVENTVHGRPQPVEAIDALADLAHRHGLSVHLDGARLMNAAVALGVPAKRILENVDSVSVCLSKGLGAPAGTIMAGPRDLVARARRLRKMVGGGMRQVGVIAAAGLYALRNNIERMAEDHANARALAAGLAGIDGVDVDMDAVETNMVFVDLPKNRAAAFRDHMRAHGIATGAYDERNDESLRMVTHLDIATDDIPHVVDAVAGFARSR